MKTSLAMVVLSVLTAANSAFAASPNFQCFNNGYREDAFKATSFDVVLQQTIPEAGGAEAIALAEENLGLKDRFSVRSVSLVLDRSEVCSTDLVPYVLKCEAAATTGTLLVSGYARTRSNVSASVTAAIQVNLKDLKLVSHVSARGPIPVTGEAVTVKLDQLRAQAQAQVEVNGLSFPLKLDTHFQIQDEGFTYCERLK